MKIILITLICMSSIYLYSNDDKLISSFDNKIYASDKQKLHKWHQRKDTYDLKSPFSEKHLVSTRWYTPLNDPIKFSNAILMFYSDNVFYYGTYQNGPYLEGSFEIIDNKVRLYNIIDRIKQDGWKLDDIFYTSEEIYLEIDTTLNFNYSHSLINKNGKLLFAADKSEPLNNSEVLVWGNKSIKINLSSTISNDTIGYISPVTTKENEYNYEFSCLKLVKDKDGNSKHEYISSKALFKKGIEVDIIAKSLKFDSSFCKLSVEDEYYRYALVWIPNKYIK